jgi:hypothetical protein
LNLYIKSTLKGIRENSNNTNNSISDVKPYLKKTNEFLSQIDSLINKKPFTATNQANNSNDKVKESITIKSRQDEMNLEIESLLKIRDDILLLRSSLRKGVLRRPYNKKDSSAYFGLGNIDNLQKSIINSHYKLYFELNK